jgi:hypothetical protein
MDTKGRIWQNKDLFDAYELKNYVSFAWLSDPVKKYWEVKPVECHVDMASGEKKICQSADEFDELVKTWAGAVNRSPRRARITSHVEPCSATTRQENFAEWPVLAAGRPQVGSGGRHHTASVQTKVSW